MFCNITLLLYLILIQLFLPTHLWFLLVISSHLSAPASEVADERHPPRGPDLHQADMQAMFDNGEHNTDLGHHENGGQEAVGQLPAHHARQPGHGVAADATRLRAVVRLILTLQRHAFKRCLMIDIQSRYLF